MVQRPFFFMLSALCLLSCDGGSVTPTADHDAVVTVDEDGLSGDELLADESEPSDAGFVPDVEAIATDYAGETGFIAIEPVTYYLRTERGTAGVKYLSDETRLWYSFQPADEEWEKKPIALFFNGGPGSA